MASASTPLRQSIEAPPHDVLDEMTPAELAAFRRQLDEDDEEADRDPSTLVSAEELEAELSRRYGFKL